MSSSKASSDPMKRQGIAGGYRGGFGAMVSGTSTTMGPSSRSGNHDDKKIFCFTVNITNCFSPFRDYRHMRSSWQ